MIDDYTGVAVAGLALACSNAAAARELHETGSVIAMRDLDGWYDLPRDASSTVTAWSASGTTAGAPRRDARTIKVIGWVQAASREQLLVQKDRLTNLSRGVLSVRERSRAMHRESDVRPIGLVWARVTPLFEQFTLTLQADDPLRYSSTPVDLKNGALVLPNRGKVRAFPVVTIEAAQASRVTIAHPGGSFSVEPFSWGWRVIDGRTGGFYNAEGGRLFGQGLGVPPRVEPGGSTWTISGLGAGAARAVRTEAWT